MTTTLLQKHLLAKSRFFIFLSLVVLMNCSKSGNVVWMYYDETSCSDKWTFDINNEKLKNNVSSYLDTRGIKVLEIEIYVDGITETCTACTCKTGRRVKCKVKNRDEDNLKSEGFYK